MKNPLVLSLIVYAIASLISFFVVFVIKSVYSLLKIIKKN